MQKSFTLLSYSKSWLKTISLLHRNISNLEKALSKETGKGETGFTFGPDLSRLDTLELTRRGRQEQARVIAELTSGGMKRLVQWLRRLGRAIEGFASTHTRHSHSLKGN